MLQRLLSIFSLLLFCLLAGFGPSSAAAATRSDTVTVSLAILSKSNCQFNNPASAALNFGTLDPLNPVDVTVNASLDFVCRGSTPVATFLITNDSGLYETAPGSPRMQHTTNLAAFLPYQIVLSPTTGNAPRNANQTLTVTGTVFGADYQSAIAGSYSDLVTISIQP